MVIMAACVKPLDTLDFINDIYDNSIRLDFDEIEFPFPDKAPKLYDVIKRKPIVENEFIRVNLSDVVVVKVDDFEKFEDITWFCEDITSEGLLFVMNSGESPFNVPGIFQVAVEVTLKDENKEDTEDKERYSTIFNIEIK
jgi:hypothetical protein